VVPAAYAAGFVASVSFESVTKRFGEVVAVDSLDLTIVDQEFLVLLGPSGCGKSTALRMIAGLEEPTEGDVRIGDRVVNGVEPKDRDVAMVFQSYALYPHKSVRQNIEFPLLPRGVAKGERHRLVAEAARTLGLDGLLDRKPRELSGGQRQRVALARAIVRQASVFLLDEPLSNLDAKLRTHTRAELIELHKRLETTFIYVTHDQIEAMTMASQVAILSEGVLQQVGPPQDVYARPANLFVARFIGGPPMNAMPASVRANGAASEVVLAGGSLRLSDELTGALAGRTEVVAGVRPEHLRLVDDDQIGIPARVRVVESLGHEQLVLCRVDGAEDDLIARLPGEEVAPASGERIRLGTEPRHVHVFDRETADRIEPAVAPPTGATS
jgi:multiple sugar transport system ATP-binding protein